MLLLCLFFGCNKFEDKLLDLDGNEYSIAEYNGILWMTENLKVQQDKDGSKIKFYFPNDDSNNIKEYGLLYDYETACKVCPTGWALPNDEDWDNLFFSDGDSSASEFKDNKFWGESDTSNESRFLVRPTGYGNNGEFDNFFGARTLFWSKTDTSEHIWTYIFEKGKNKIRKAQQHGTYAFSIRCIKRIE